MNYPCYYEHDQYIPTHSRIIQVTVNMINSYQESSVLSMSEYLLMIVFRRS